MYISLSLAISPAQQKDTAWQRPHFSYFHPDLFTSSHPPVIFMQHLTSLSTLKYVIARGSRETRKITDLCQGEGSSRPSYWMPPPGKHAAPRNVCLLLLDIISKMKYFCTWHNSSCVPRLSQSLYERNPSAQSCGHRSLAAPSFSPTTSGMLCTGKKINHHL